MKGLGIMLLAILLAIAAGYGNAQQSPEPGSKESVQQYKFPENQKPEEYKFPVNPNPQEYKFPESPKTEENKIPENQPGEKGTSPLLKGQKGKEEQAGPVKTYSPKEKKAYLKRSAANLDAIQQRSAAFKVKEGQDTRQRKRANMMLIVNLQKKTLIARNRLAALEKAPEGAWGRGKFEMDKAMGDVQKAFSDALEYFEEVNSPQGPKGR